MKFDFSTVPGWAWGIRPMNVVQQTFDHIMDKEFEALIAEIDYQIHCENLTRGFTVIALESLLSQEIQKMSLLQRLNLERARLGYKLPTTVKEVEICESQDEQSNADHSDGLPNTCPVACALDGQPGIFALHRFSDGDIWLVRLHDHSDNWVTMRTATDADRRTIQSLYPSTYRPSDEDD